jgi:hypothetical protein
MGAKCAQCGYRVEQHDEWWCPSYDKRSDAGRAGKRGGGR